MEFETINFGGFEIKIGLLKGGYRYNAFKKGTNNQYFRNHEFFKSKEELLDYIKNKILEHNQITLQKRVNGVPTTEEFVEAINFVKPTDAQWAMLKAHYHAPERKLTSLQLAKAGNYDHFYTGNTQYGTLGGSIARHLNYTPPGKYDDGKPLWITTITEDNHYNSDEDTGHFQHILREEVAKALKLLGAI